MMCICQHDSFCIQRDPHEESPHALRGSRLPMRWMRRKLRHPERVFHPQEKCSRKRREIHKIRMPHSQLWFPNWKTRRACGSRALRSSEPGKRSLTDSSFIVFCRSTCLKIFDRLFHYWFSADPPVRPLWPQLCGRGEVEQPHDQPREERKDQENVRIKLWLSPLP